NNLRRLSIKTALKLYENKIRPILTYALQTFSRYLKASNLREVDRSKAQFLKKCLCLSKNTSNTLVLSICNEKSEVHTLQDKFVFNAAELANYTGRLYRRRQELNMEYQQLGPAFTSTRWMDAGQRNRHIITRCTVHGFHFMICTRSHCYNITQDCSCKICG